MTDSQALGTIKSVIKSETGELWTTVTIQEYMHLEKNYAPSKIIKFKKWRENIAKSFWNKLHKLAENHGADCDRYY